MPHILKNKQLEIHIDHPLEQYQAPRFDWTGKIRVVHFQNIPISGIERTDGQNEPALGKGFYNEFGIDTALGFEAAPIGGWFHKIGIGLLKKTANEYAFHKAYDIQPAAFTIEETANKLVIHCQSALVNGYAYTLQKTIELKESSFIIHYYLKNVGKKVILTDEYVHNFMAINHALISPDYCLNFPFYLKPALFEETVNPEEKVILRPKDIQFNGTPEAPFFFSNLSGNEAVPATWELINQQHKIGIRESGNFKTDKINLWGWKHVISPELFYKINLAPKQSTEWTRQYDVYKIK